MEIFFLFWLVFSVVVGVVAAQRGRSGVGWALLAMLTSPLLAVIVLLLMKDLVEEAARQEREASRHREQLAALSASAQPPVVVTNPVPSAPQAPLLVADELEKLASQRDRGLLTADEFATQKARLLSGATAGTAARTVAGAPAAPLPKTPQYQLRSIKDYADALKTQGCTVTERTHGGYAVRKPNGTILYAQSLEELATIYESV